MARFPIRAPNESLWTIKQRRTAHVNIKKTSQNTVIQSLPSREAILFAKINHAPNLSLFLSLCSVVESTKLDVNWRALVSNKTPKPGWYRAYCRSHSVWNWPVWVPVCPSVLVSVYICLRKPNIYKGLLWNQKVWKHLQPLQGSKGKLLTAPVLKLKHMQTRVVPHLHFLLLFYQAPLSVYFKETWTATDQSCLETQCTSRWR